MYLLLFFCEIGVEERIISDYVEIVPIMGRIISYYCPFESSLPGRHFCVFLKVLKGFIFYMTVMNKKGHMWKSHVADAFFSSSLVDFLGYISFPLRDRLSVLNGASVFPEVMHINLAVSKWYKAREKSYLATLCRHSHKH